LYFMALATDYDGTLAHDGLVNASTIAALEDFKETGRRLILITGRELPHLKEAFPQLKMFDRVVAENGALIYDPATEEERLIGPGPSPQLVARLRQLGVSPMSVGRCIVATWEPHETTVLQVIRELGLELQIIFNKGAVMVLPPGVNKAAGLAAALNDMELSAHNVVGVGDAENDHAFLRACGCAAAVANALPLVKEAADVKLVGDHGAGVVELMESICRDDAHLASLERHGILLGTAQSHEVFLEPYRGNILITGKSGIGKSTLATALTERMAEKNFAFCVFDPEGDYDELRDAVSIGSSNTPPSDEEAIKLLRAATNVVINTQCLSLKDRPGFFGGVLPQVSLLRAKTGRPHWLVIDEAHHLLPASRHDVANVFAKDAPAAIFITVHPDAVSRDALKSVDVVIALGDGANEVISQFCRLIEIAPPEMGASPSDDEVLVWVRSSGQTVRAVKPARPQQAHKRHTRKYAEGDLGEELSFYFRGPDNALYLRAQNLMLFLQIARGVDDGTWTHHLRKGDYSVWFQTVIKDNELAREAAEVEANQALDPSESRDLIEEAVKRRYKAPASGA
jgi:hydroxymethylpyrimidine pyrophosphatase-like HAD family hydrolase